MRPLLFVFLVFFVQGLAAAQQDQTLTIMSGNRERAVLVHLPASAPAVNLPVLLCYHGTGGTAQGIRSGTGLDPLADRYGFIVAYPQSLTIGADVQWNVFVDDQPGHGGLGQNDAPDDVQFTRDIIARLRADWGVDTRRVYATGHSNGGFMCYALSMLAADAIAGIAPVGANLWANDVFLGQLVMSGTVPVIPVMHVHGTADGVVEYPDKDNTPKDYEEYPLFVSGRDCGALTYGNVVPIMQNADKLVFCTAPVEVSLIRITGMGHTWSNGVYPTSEEIVKFFKLNTTTHVADVLPAPVRIGISPLPATTTVQVHLERSARIRIYSLLGAEVFTAELGSGNSTIPLRGLPAGVYHLRAEPFDGIGMSSVRLLVGR